ASDIDMQLVEYRVFTMSGELDLELQMILRDGLAAHRAGRTNSWSAPCTVGSSGWQLSSAGHFSGFRAKNSLVGHGESPGSGGVVMPDARRPDACSRHPGARWKATDSLHL